MSARKAAKSSGRADRIAQKAQAVQHHKKGATFVADHGHRQGKVKEQTTHNQHQQ